LSAGTRRNGSSKFGPFKTREPGKDWALEEPSSPYYDPPGEVQDAKRDQRAENHAGQQVGPRHKAARNRVGKAVPAAAVAATLAAGAAVYGFVGNGNGHPKATDLSASLALPVSLSSAAHAGTGSANAAASAVDRVARKAGTGAARVSSRHKAVSSAKASAKPTVSPSAASSATGAPAAATSGSAGSVAVAAATPSARQVASASPTKTAAATLSCNLSSGLLPENVTAIVSFLVANGYSDNAAAGIAGNIYQESKGDPESVGSGGGGLIGWTPLPSGFVTGNVATDLQAQLAAILTYNQQWASYLPELNAAASPAAAADIYVTDFERAGIPAASTREAAAEAVASACGI
jgi:hypothetical protein